MIKFVVLSFTILLFMGCVTQEPSCCPHCGGQAYSRSEAEPVQKHLLPKGGYVYVIANPKAFGSGIYKIGMTRRVDPAKRIKELGDASVPFPFQTICLLQTDSPRELERFLHKRLNNRRISKSKEFFKLSRKELSETLAVSQTVIPSVRLDRP